MTFDLNLATLTLISLENEGVVVMYIPTMVNRKRGFLGQREKWYISQQEIKVVNSY